MPHVIIEYSNNVHEVVQAAQITKHAHETLINSGLFSTPDIKTRSYSAEDYLVGDKGKDGSFLHICVYLLDGRSVEKKQALSEALRDMLVERLPQVDQLSVDIRDLSREIYRKRKPAA